MAMSCIKNMQANSVQEITWKTLHRADRSLAVPFQFMLDGQEIPIICDEVVRIIPGKRLVAFGMWDEQPVVAKLFYEGRRAKKHIAREIAGLEVLAEARVPTPKILYRGTTQKKRVQVLIFERLFDVKSLHDLWQERDSIEEIAPVMHAAVIELATQHVLGIVQNDLHLKNLLVQGKQIYTLDGSTIEYHEGSPLERKLSLDHLALFFTQLGVGAEQLQQELFKTYSKARGWIVRKPDVKFLHTAIEKWY